MLIFNMVTIYQ